MKKTLMCLTAVAWLWIAKGQERGTPQRDPQNPGKNQKIISFKPDDRESEQTLNQILNPGKNQTFIKTKTKRDSSLGVQTEIYDQFYKGVRVDNGEIRVIKQNGKLKFLFQDVAEMNTDFDVKPKLSPERGLENALQKVAAKKYAWQDPEREKALQERKKDRSASYFPKAELVILSDSGLVQLAYKAEIFALDPWTREEIYIDAQTGDLIKKNDLLTNENALENRSFTPPMPAITTNDDNLEFAELQISVYGFIQPSFGVFDTPKQLFYLNDRGAKIHTWAATKVDKSNKIPFEVTEFKTTDKANVAGTVGDFIPMEDNFNYSVATRVHYGMEVANSYFLSKFNRLSYSGEYAPINAYVYPILDGSFYDREESLFFPFWPGSEDNEDITLEASLQTVYHEYAHAFTVSESGLIGGFNESGMINEGLSDIWSYIIADAYVKTNPIPPLGAPLVAVPFYTDYYGNNWKTVSGNDAFQDLFELGKGYSIIRDAQNPNTNKYPDFYQGLYWNSQSDEHFKSTVISHWFYLLSEGASVPLENSPATIVDVQGISIEKAAKIIYFTTTNLLNSHTDFQGFALRTLLAAKMLFGEDSQEVNSIINAWEAVGIGNLGYSSALGCYLKNYDPHFYISKFELANVTTIKPKDFAGGYRDYGFLNIEGRAGGTYDMIINTVDKTANPKPLYWSIYVDINGDKSFVPNEKIASGLKSGPITLPALLKGNKSFMRIVLSPNQNTSSCKDQIDLKDAKYIEDYGITIEDYCPIVESTLDDYKKKNGNFNGLVFKSVKLLECDGDVDPNNNPVIFDLNLAPQQKLVQIHSTLEGNSRYSLMFKLNPLNLDDRFKPTSVPNTFLTTPDCQVQPPYGFSLGDNPKDYNPEQSGGGTSRNPDASPCDMAIVDVKDNKEDAALCPHHLARVLWIDLNRNGDFENSESYLINYDETTDFYYCNFEIPNWATTLKGKTRMRIYLYVGNIGLSEYIDACGNGKFKSEITKMYPGIEFDPIISKNGLDIEFDLDKPSDLYKMAPAPEERLLQPISSSEEVSLEPVSLVLYPNPASNLVDLSVKGTRADGFTLELYNSEGTRLLMKQPWDGGPLDVSRYPKGLYFLILKRDGEVYKQKLLIDR